mmetsp:Transcript_2435/g.6720  ORF Transcript_2435/g.6720 Transcript_2435/m.6720 type:complete len:313 (+) Transcript_2435:1615-2553(+)
MPSTRIRMATTSCPSRKRRRTSAPRSNPKPSSRSSRCSGSWKRSPLPQRDTKRRIRVVLLKSQPMMRRVVLRVWGVAAIDFNFFVASSSSSQKKLSRAGEERRERRGMQGVRARAGATAVACGAGARASRPGRRAATSCRGADRHRDYTEGVRPRERRSGLVQASTEIPSVSANEGEGEGLEARVAFVERKTKETSVFVKLDIDGTGKCDCDSGVPFLDHMLDQIASHGLFDIEVKAEGDTWIDDHHTTEDIALAFGQCLSRALGTRAGIYRFGDFCAPLDEALIHVVMVSERTERTRGATRALLRSRSLLL